MPDFVAALATATVFCLGVCVLNALTRLALRLHLAPTDLAENGFAQFGLALIVALALWRRMAAPGAGTGTAPRA